MRIFPQARVQHVSLSISDHCLLALSIKRRQPQKPAKKGFFFECGLGRKVVGRLWSRHGIRCGLIQSIRSQTESGAAKTNFKNGTGKCLGTYIKY